MKLYISGYFGLGLSYPHFKIKGVPIMIPETAVFQGGKPKFVTRMHRDNTFTIQSSGRMLNLGEIMKAIMRSSRQRKKEVQSNIGKEASLIVTTTSRGRRSSLIEGEESNPNSTRLISVRKGSIPKNPINDQFGGLSRMNTNASKRRAKHFKYKPPERCNSKYEGDIKPFITVPKHKFFCQNAIVDEVKNLCGEEIKKEFLNNL